MDTMAAVRAIPQGSRIDLLTDIARERAWLDFLETTVLHAIDTDPEPYPGDELACDKDWVREEVAATLRLAPATAGNKLHVATALATRFPTTLTAMEGGDVPGFYATRLVELTDQLPDGLATEVEHRVLPNAGRWTLSQFTRAIRRAVLAVDPATAEQKHERSRQDRKVVFNPVGDDGMVELWALLPADEAAKLRAKIDALAGSWKGLDDRTGDQRRADALCALGDADFQLRANVNVTMPLSTLLGLTDSAADLDNDPVTAEIARIIAHDPSARWRRLLLDDNGHLCDVASDTYKPPAPMERFVELRDQTCQFPGCSRTAARCEQDHTIPWSEGGPTCPANPRSLCLRHHQMKHKAGWTYRVTTDRTTTDATTAGTVIWTSPTGHTYERPPPEPPPF